MKVDFAVWYVANDVDVKCASRKAVLLFCARILLDFLL